MSNAYSTLYDDAVSHGCKIIVHRIAYQNSSHLELEIHCPTFVVQGYMTAPLSIEQQASGVLNSKTQGLWGWPDDAVV